MSATATTQTEIAVARQVDERETVTRMHDNLMQTIEARDDKTPTEPERVQMTSLRERAVTLDEEIAAGVEAIERDRKAIEQSRKIRRVLSGSVGVEEDGDEIVYRDIATYARDFILTRQGPICSQIASQYADHTEIERAKERLALLKRTPANTLTSDLAGLNPAQHIAQIFQVIDSSRPLVASAIQTGLVRGTLTYPQVDATPVVAVQTTQKTEAGNTGMDISMVTRTASTYLGGGDLSWQAINWSTPDALDLWFRFCAADYALKTEQDAAQILQHSGFSNNIASTIGGTPTFAELMTAIGAGYAEVWANSARTADTVYMAPDRFGYLLGLTSSSFTQFTSVNGSNIGPLNIVVSRGMDAGVVVVGDRSGLLCAETPGAPVELRVVEPAIGGVEVGLIGAFEAAVVDDGAFAMLTTAS